jgi:predicted lipoprotein
MLREFATTLCLTLLAAPVRADVTRAVETLALPGYEAFAGAADELARTTSETCDRSRLARAYQQAFDRWMAVSHLRLGPVEDEGRYLAIAFWPDVKGNGQRTVAALVAAADPAMTQPDRFATISVAARGLFGLERLIYAEQDGAYVCALTAAAAADLAQTARAVAQDWQKGFAAALKTAGEPGNSLFLTTDEAKQAMFTQLMTGLEFTADQRLGRPLGTFDKPRPERAEARLSERSQRNVVLSLQALKDLAIALARNTPKTSAAFDRAISQAAALDDPVLAGVADPQKRLKIEILQQSVRAAREAALAEIGPDLGVGIGFNSADGD